MRPLPFIFSLRTSDAFGVAAISCHVNDRLWAALRALPEELLFHPRLIEALEDLTNGVTEGDLTNAVLDMLLNGAEV